MLVTKKEEKKGEELAVSKEEMISEQNKMQKDQGKNQPISREIDKEEIDQNVTVQNNIEIMTEEDKIKEDKEEDKDNTEIGKTEKDTIEEIEVIEEIEEKEFKDNREEDMKNRAEKL